MSKTWGSLTWNVGDWGSQTDSTVSVTGIGASSNLGSLTTTATVEFGWSRLSWGENAWGEQGDVVLSGLSMSASLGDESIVVDANPIPTGIEMTASQGDESIEISFEIIPTGIAATANLGTADAGPDAMATGIGFSANVGSVEAFNAEGWGRYGWGIFDWGVSGEWEQVTPTGIEMSAAINPDGVPTFTAEADAQLSTAQAKFGSSSLLLDGTGDFVQSTATDVVQNNFTIEFFAYASNFAQNAYLWDNHSSNQGFAFSITSAGQLRLIQDNTILQQTSSSGLNNNQWNHIALVQNSTLLTLYINGAPKLQYSTGGDSYPGQSYKIGANEGETQFFNGYIDEFRSSDIARYTTTFTPTTSAFAVDGNTISLLHFDGANGSTQIFNETQNAYSITGTGNTDVTGIAMTAAEGDVDPSPDATVTGIGFGMAVGTGTVTAEADIDVTGITMTASLGQETIALNTPVDTTGIAMTATLSEESVVGDAIVQLTGIGLTMSLNSANALIWNEVNTGSAPIDPPGWQEVPTRAA
jgi:hypothetical protein